MHFWNFPHRLLCRHAIVFALLISCSYSTHGQTIPAIDGVGVGAGGGEGSRFPFRVKLSGTLNPTTPENGSIKVATLSISGYRETYQFAIRSAEAVDDKQMPRAVIIPRIVATDYDYRVVGTSELLSKIGQSLPNTPVTIIGFLRQRNRQLIIDSIEVPNIHDLLPGEQRETAQSLSAPPPAGLPPEQ